MPIKVLIVDNSLFMRQLVTELFKSDPDIVVVGTAKKADRRRFEGDSNN